MERNKARNTQIVYGICTNTGGKKDGTACSKCQNKEKQAIRASKEFICEECGEPLTKVDPPHPKPPKWLFVVLALVVIGGCVGAYLGLFKGSEKTNEPVSLSLNKEKISLYVGESDTLKATVYSQPEDANVSVFFASDNVKVARVDNNGVVYAVSKGEANITVIAQMEIGVSDTASVYVTVNNMSKEQPPSEKQPNNPDGGSSSSIQEMEIDWRTPVNVCDDEISTALNSLIGKHTNIAARVKSVLEKYFAENCIVDEIGVNGSNLVNYHLPIKDYLESVCISKYLKTVRVLEIKRNGIGRLTYLKVQESHHREPQAKNSL